MTKQIYTIIFGIFFLTTANAGNGQGTLSFLEERAGETSFSTQTGGNGGGGGVHPSRVQPTDYVRMQTLTNERIIKFQYKPAESNTIQSYSVPVESVSQQYLDALEKSAATNNWESIEVQ